MRVRVDGAGRHFALLCHSLSLFESQLDHCLSPFPAFIHCGSITERAIYASLSHAGLARVLPTEATPPPPPGPPHRLSHRRTCEVMPCKDTEPGLLCRLPLGGLHTDPLNHARLSYQRLDRNDSRQSETRCGEEGAIFGLGALAPPSSDQHFEIAQFRNGRLVASRDQRLDDQQLTLLLHGPMTVLEDRDRPGIVPVVDNPPEQVRVTARWHRRKEVPCHRGTALSHALRLQKAPCACNDVGEVKEDPAQLGIRL